MKDWPKELYEVMKAQGVRQVAYVPDAGHDRLIRLCHADGDLKTVVLSTEEEGIALLSGAWLGGEKGVMLMQSSGVGNCVNMLSLVESARFPFVTLVTMRGEWGEFNPWQIPMARRVNQAFEMMGLKTYRVERPEDAAPTLDAALRFAFDGDQGVAILLGQRLIGRKSFVGEAE